MFAEESSGHAHHDTLNNFEHFFKAPVDFGLFGFGLANAGVPFSGIGDATWAVLLALVVGKTAGITLMSGIGHLVGFSLPEGMNLKTLVVAGFVAALGLTVALFVAGAAFTDPGIQGAAKMGALFSAGVAPLAIILSRAMGIKRMN
jgi:NhaA family Na+:H+ antiporter